MMDRPAIEQILAQYAKHGWKLRRVLLSEKMSDHLGDGSSLFAGADVRPASLDAAWFSRSSHPGITAWEIRHLSAAPFAYVESIIETTPGAKVEIILKRAETKMIAVINGRNTAA